ncbi:MAG TPA: hypothetical protein PLV42_08480 [bacterium]|nr:hypothetical protein [bacterium]
MRNTIYAVGKAKLGALEQRFLSYSQLRRLTVVRYGQLREELFLTAAQEKRMLSRLARSGMIVRLKREVYLVPSRLPLGGAWNPGENLILQELMRASDDGVYQLCGLQTFNRYGFSEQIAARVYCYNNRISGEKVIAGLEFTFIKVADGRLGGVERLETPEGAIMIMPTKARVLMDAVYDWSRFNTLPRAYEWITAAVQQEGSIAVELAEMAVRYGNQGTVRRIGHLLDRLTEEKGWKKKMLGALSAASSLFPLIPGRPAKGKIDREWGVQVNE